MFICICAAGISGCGKQDTQSEGTQPTKESVNETVDYKIYEGTWAVDGTAHDDIIAGGGTEMVCSIDNNNEFSGNIFTQQSETERFAYIDEISGVIENDELFFSFEDDGWGGQGTLHIQFADDKIKIEILDYKMAEDNPIGYGINGTYEMIRVED